MEKKELAEIQSESGKKEKKKKIFRFYFFPLKWPLIKEFITINSLSPPRGWEVFRSLTSTNIRNSTEAIVQPRRMLSASSQPKHCNGII